MQQKAWNRGEKGRIFFIWLASTSSFILFKELKEDANQFVSGFLQTRLSQRELGKGTMDQLKVNTMWLTGAGKKRSSKPSRRKLSARQKKALKLYEIPKECQKLVNGTKV